MSTLFALALPMGATGSAFSITAAAPSSTGESSPSVDGSRRAVAAGGGRPSYPPAPSPGGVSPATVAGGEFAPASSLLLASLLMLAAPAAMRRLRLASEPWHLAPLVLIPDRPA